MAISRDVDESEVHETILTVKRLYPQAGKNHGWVLWSSVAREQTGSEEAAAMLSSMATMEPWKKYFISGDKGVQLTEEGHHLSKTLKPPKLTEIQHIAKCVRNYAGRLENTGLTVTRVSRVAKVGARYVQAFTVDASDEPVASETPCTFKSDDGGSSISGHIIGQEPDGGVIYVALDCQVFESSLPAKLWIERRFLLKQLADRLSEFRAIPPRMAAAFQKQNTLNLYGIADPNSLSVAKQLMGLRTPWTQFLWGHRERAKRLDWVTSFRF